MDLLKSVVKLQRSFHGFHCVQEVADNLMSQGCILQQVLIFPKIVVNTINICSRGLMNVNKQLEKNTKSCIMAAEMMSH